MMNQLRTVGQQYGRLGTTAQTNSMAFATGAQFVGEAFSSMEMAAAAFGVKFGSAVLESENLAGRTFGNMYKDIQDFSERLGKASSMNEYEVRRQAAIFMNLATALKIPRGEALEMSKAMVQLGIDMSSYYDLPVERVMTNLASGMIGNTRALYSYGVSLDQTTLKNYAYKNGIAEVGSELNKQQKVLAAFGEIMNQTQNAQGDFLKSYPTSAANQGRLVMAAYTKELADFGIAMQDVIFGAIKMGRDVIPIANKMVKAFGGLGPEIQFTALMFGAAAGPIMRFSTAMYTASLMSGQFQGSFGGFMMKRVMPLVGAATLGTYMLGRYLKGQSSKENDEMKERFGTSRQELDTKDLFGQAARAEIERRQKERLQFPGEDNRPILRAIASGQIEAPDDTGGPPIRIRELRSPGQPDIQRDRSKPLYEVENRAMGGKSGGLTIVGERGPEAVVLPEGSHVIPNHRMHKVERLGRVRDNDAYNFGNSGIPHKAIGDATSERELFDKPVGELWSDIKESTGENAAKGIKVLQDRYMQSMYRTSVDLDTAKKLAGTDEHRSIIAAAKKKDSVAARTNAQTGVIASLKANTEFDNQGHAIMRGLIGGFEGVPSLSAEHLVHEKMQTALIQHPSTVGFRTDLKSFNEEQQRRAVADLTGIPSFLMAELGMDVDPHVFGILDRKTNAQGAFYSYPIQKMLEKVQADPTLTGNDAWNVVKDELQLNAIRAQKTEMEANREITSKALTRSQELRAQAKTFVDENLKAKGMKVDKATKASYIEKTYNHLVSQINTVPRTPSTIAGKWGGIFTEAFSQFEAEGKAPKTDVRNYMLLAEAIAGEGGAGPLTSQLSAELAPIDPRVEGLISGRYNYGESGANPLIFVRELAQQLQQSALASPDNEETIRRLNSFREKAYNQDWVDLSDVGGETLLENLKKQQAANKENLVERRRGGGGVPAVLGERSFEVWADSMLKYTDASGNFMIHQNVNDTYFGHGLPFSAVTGSSLSGFGDSPENYTTTIGREDSAERDTRFRVQRGKTLLDNNGNVLLEVPEERLPPELKRGISDSDRADLLQRVKAHNLFVGGPNRNSTLDSFITFDSFLQQQAETGRSVSHTVDPNTLIAWQSEPRIAEYIAAQRQAGKNTALQDAFYTQMQDQYSSNFLRRSNAWNEVVTRLGEPYRARFGEWSPDIQTGKTTALASSFSQRGLEAFSRMTFGFNAFGGQSRTYATGTHDIASILSGSSVVQAPDTDLLSSLRKERDISEVLNRPLGADKSNQLRHLEAQEAAHNLNELRIERDLLRLRGPDGKTQLDILQERRNELFARINAGENDPEITRQYNAARRAHDQALQRNTQIDQDMERAQVVLAARSAHATGSFTGRYGNRLAFAQAASTATGAVGGDFHSTATADVMASMLGTGNEQAVLWQAGRGVLSSNTGNASSVSIDPLTGWDYNANQTVMHSHPTADRYLSFDDVMETMRKSFGVTLDGTGNPTSFNHRGAGFNILAGTDVGGGKTMLAGFGFSDAIGDLAGIVDPTTGISEQQRLFSFVSEELVGADRSFRVSQAINRNATVGNEWFNTGSGILDPSVVGLEAGGVKAIRYRGNHVVRTRLSNGMEQSFRRLPATGEWMPVDGVDARGNWIDTDPASVGVDAITEAAAAIKANEAAVLGTGKSTKVGRNDVNRFTGRGNAELINDLMDRIVRTETRGGDATNLRNRLNNLIDPDNYEKGKTGASTRLDISEGASANERGEYRMRRLRGLVGNTTAIFGGRSIADFLSMFEGITQDSSGARDVSKSAAYKRFYEDGGYRDHRLAIQDFVAQQGAGVAGLQGGFNTRGVGGFGQRAWDFALGDQQMTANDFLALGLKADGTPRSGVGAFRSRAWAAYGNVGTLQMAAHIYLQQAQAREMEALDAGLNDQQRAKAEREIIERYRNQARLVDGATTAATITMAVPPLKDGGTVSSLLSRSQWGRNFASGRLATEGVGATLLRAGGGTGGKIFNALGPAGQVLGAGLSMKDTLDVEQAGIEHERRMGRVGNYGTDSWYDDRMDSLNLFKGSGFGYGVGSGRAGNKMLGAVAVTALPQIGAALGGLGLGGIAAAAGPASLVAAPVAFGLISAANVTERDSMAWEATMGGVGPDGKPIGRISESMQAIALLQAEKQKQENFASYGRAGTWAKNPFKNGAWKNPLWWAAETAVGAIGNLFSLPGAYFGSYFSRNAYGSAKNIDKSIAGYRKEIAGTVVDEQIAAATGDYKEGVKTRSFGAFAAPEMRTDEARENLIALRDDLKAKVNMTPEEKARKRAEAMDKIRKSRLITNERRGEKIQEFLANAEIEDAYTSKDVDRITGALAMGQVKKSEQMEALQKLNKEQLRWKINTSGMQALKDENFVNMYSAVMGPEALKQLASASSEARLNELADTQLGKFSGARRKDLLARQAQILAEATPKRARGGAAGGLTIVGERGPEAVMLPQGSHVLPNTLMNRLNHADTYDFGRGNYKAGGDAEAMQRLGRIQGASVAAGTPAVKTNYVQDSDYTVNVQVIKRDRFQLNKAT